MYFSFFFFIENLYTNFTIEKLHQNALKMYFSVNNSKIGCIEFPDSSMSIWGCILVQVSRISLFSFKYCSSFYLRMFSYLFSLKFHSFRTVRTEWRILVDSEFLWTLFNSDNKCCQRRGCGGKLVLSSGNTMCSVRSGGAGASPCLDQRTLFSVRVRLG